MVLNLILGRRRLSEAMRPLTRAAIFGVGGNSSSGTRVTPETALGLPAYLAALANTSEDLAKLPLPVYRRLPRGRAPVDEHRLNHVLNVEFNEHTPAMVGRQTLEAWALGWGNGYAEIEVDGRGQALHLHPIHPSRVTPYMNPQKELFYRIISDKGYVELAAYRMFHLPGRLSDDGVTGISVAQAARDPIGRGLAAQTYGGTVFGSGGQERLALKHPQRLSPQAAQNLRDSWKKAYGNAEAGVAVLEEGMDAVKIGIPPKDAQLIESENWSVEDVCRLFRCPPSKVGHFARAQGWSTLEMLNTDYVTDTLLSRAVRWEQEIGRKLLVGRQEGGLYARHNFKMLLRGDSAARSAFYTSLFRLGVLNRDEIRELEEMNPVDGGETYWIEGSNLQPLDEDGLPIQPEPPEPVPEDEPEQDDGPADGAEDVEAVTETHNEKQDNGALAAAQAAVAHAYTLVGKRELARCRAAAKRMLPGYPDAFAEWAEEFYQKFQGEAEDMAGHACAVLFALGGECDTVAEYLTRRRVQLLAVLRDEGADGAEKRLSEWEQST